MKHIRCILIICIVLLLLCGCSRRGDISEVYLDIGDPEHNTIEEIHAAMNVVLKTFEKDFGGCTMTALRYDEAQSIRAYSDDKKGIVLRCDFQVDSSGGDGSLNPNSTYKDYTWYLENQNGVWVIVNNGYG